MRLSTSALAFLPLLVTTLVSAAAVTFSLPPSALLTNSATLPPSTKATLFRHGRTITARLTQRNTFEFFDLDAGSYLFTVQCRDFAFGPLRLDVSSPFAQTLQPLDDGDSNVAESQSGEAGEMAQQVESVEAWQTFWGNEWSNKGARVGSGTVRSRMGAGNEEATDDAVVIEIKPERPKEYYAERSAFSPLDFLKSPMILMALASLGLIFGMPYLINSMDDETRAEFEEMQKKNPVAQAANPAQALQNFDLASWMAGKQS